MTLRQYLVVLALGTAMSISSWCIVMIAIDPTTAGALAYFVFYLTLGAGVAGICTMSGTVFRSWKYPDRPIDQAVARSLRQGIVLSALFMTCLILLSQSLFSFGTMMTLVALAALVEALFLSISVENREV
jgi:hypothetical protein